MGKQITLADGDIQRIVDDIVSHIRLYHHYVLGKCNGNLELRYYEFTVSELACCIQAESGAVERVIKGLCQRLLTIKLRKDTQNLNGFDYTLLFSRVSYRNDRIIVYLNDDALACIDEFSPMPA
ncbi:hypothetical protein CS022_21465 [Veronia nyctiphanis]|uniref:Uncharacterized protein n=1 Tax=Veronia nyctiphanis TaxID=1278244 RepID=A0A4Q0YLC4_9GAMM|nr:hypothetical protein [Veronia nyctiphanis]RXJ71233.1 hypothetical protein CS022_21465 [Veronia nyctiphanis]